MSCRIGSGAGSKLLKIKLVNNLKFKIMDIALQNWIPFIICAVSAISFLTQLILNTIKESKKTAK